MGALVDSLHITSAWFLIPVVSWLVIALLNRRNAR